MGSLRDKLQVAQTVGLDSAPPSYWCHLDIMVYNNLRSTCVMKRTNIYLAEEEPRLLKHIAVEEGCSFTALVRQALQEFLKRYQQKTRRVSPADEWNRRLENLL